MISWISIAVPLLLNRSVYRKILAMNLPSGYDPNSIGEIWEDLVDNDSSTVLVNRATQGLYPPGSTFKIVTALEYIQGKSEYLPKLFLYLQRAFRLNSQQISCYHGSSHGTVDFTRSFAKSCNSSFANYRNEPGPDCFFRDIK